VIDEGIVMILQRTIGILYWG